MRVLLVSPHPDDEIVGAPGTAIALRMAGHKVTNLAVGLGRTEQHDTRLRELAECARRAGFDYEAITPPIPLSTTEGDDLLQARATLALYLRRTLDDYDLVISPGVPDGHPAHEAVSLAAADAMTYTDEPPHWWTWATSPRAWKSELDSRFFVPNLAFLYHSDIMCEALVALSAHKSEMSRHDYRIEVVRRALASARWLGRSSAWYADLLVDKSRGATLDHIDPLHPVQTVRRGDKWTITDTSVSKTPARTLAATSVSS